MAYYASEWPGHGADSGGSSEEVSLKDEFFDFESTYRFLKDGRLIEIDPETGTWNRRPQGIAKELWDNMPSARPYLKMLRDVHGPVEKARSEPICDDGQVPFVVAPVSSRATDVAPPRTTHRTSRVRHLSLIPI